MEKKAVVLKLGGSLLTDKSNPYTLRENALKVVAQEIKECIDLGLIEELGIIHGVGSFGHPPVLKHNLHKGFRNPDQLKKLSKAQQIVNSYRSEIAKNLLDVTIPVNLIPAIDMLKIGLKVFIISMMKSGTLRSLLQRQEIDLTEVIFN